MCSYSIRVWAVCAVCVRHSLMIDTPITQGLAMIAFLTYWATTSTLIYHMAPNFEEYYFRGLAFYKFSQK